MERMVVDDNEEGIVLGSCHAGIGTSNPPVKAVIRVSKSQSSRFVLNASLYAYTSAKNGQQSSTGNDNCLT